MLFLLPDPGKTFVNSSKKEMLSYLNGLRYPVRLAIARNVHFDRNLPRLPVPPLKDTLAKYLRSVKPFLNNHEFDETTCIVQKYGEQGGVGEQLQELLIRKAQLKDNWLEEWWLKSAYLEFRSPVVYFSSPGLVFPKQIFKNEEAKLNYAAKVVVAAIDYKLKIDADKIPQEKMGKNPLDMSQYKKVFGTCRIPAYPCDKIEYNPKSKHIIVMHNNYMYKLEVTDDCQKQIAVPQIKNNLKKIVEDSCSKPAEPIGILSSDHRDNWAKAYADLINDSSNREAIKTITTSLFILCLDKPYSPCDQSGTDPDMNVAGLQCMHGGGSANNGGNRWFDKTIQFVIGHDGHVGLTYEHSPAEGQPIAVMMDHIVNYLSSNQDWTLQPSEYAPEPELLSFNITGSIKEHINKAETNLDKLVDDVEISCFKFENYGKDFIKKQKLSPDSFLQMAMQYAFYRLHKVPGAHYESAATRIFLKGRTETIRSCSVESIKFAITMLNGSVSVAEKIKALREAVEGHRQYTLQAVQGLGVDRHLLGLKLTAKENNVCIPELYTDKAFTRSLHMRISTSQVASKCDGFMVYGPIVKDGYACCYNPRPNDVNFGITAHKCCPETSAFDFRDALEDSLMEMHDLFMQPPQAKL